MVSFENLATYSYFGNTGQDYLYALGIFIISLLILYIIKFIILNRVKALAKKTKSRIDDIIIEFIESIHWPFYILLSLYIALRYLTLPALFNKIANYTIIIVASYYAITGIHHIIDYGTDIIKKKEKVKVVDSPFIDLLSRFLKISLWIIGVIWILSNLGFNVTSLVAGLGIGGIAVALALQNILTDIFASFSIYFDKPFRVGDFIIVGNDLGTVQKIGIKTTRIKTLQGQELIVSNKELTETRINNYKRMEKRRIVFTFGVTYDTSSKKLKKIPQIIAEIIKKIKLADLDRVHFKEYGDFSLNFEIVYYVNSSDYTTYMDIQQKINLAIKERFEKEKIEMAFPTQTIHLEK